MAIRHYLAQLLRYNSWANEMMCGAIPRELLDVITPSSFESLRKTVLHMWDAEWVWFERVHGRSPGLVDREKFEGPFDEAVRFMLEQNAQWITLVESLGDEDLHETITYTNLAGKQSSRRFDEIVMHVCNHSTFHRGQLVTILRANGVDSIPGTDIILYFGLQL